MAPANVDAWSLTGWAPAEVTDVTMMFFPAASHVLIDSGVSPIDTDVVIDPSTMCCSSRC
ncbi:hypothetical protein [Streptomyces sp. 35G-GA-8]|uniref:hypothetical protein n=1 Tax=Streptomyces sp. 35G-GA-8 TaxID=2939434 RepID=UPI00201F40B7|nr:hypothetical protein [Streptomyces sp. 35G-GA-8]MCL7382492.1 hypothetical protein [Streptomyces sp. 35G-GA-8]